MTTLPEFLLAQIEADEAVARAALGDTVYGAGVQGDYAADEVVEMGRREGAAKAGYDYLMEWMPARVLRECAAKRAIVDDCQRIVDTHFADDFTADILAESTLLRLAQPYADHPDFDARWAP